ncbi:Zn(II)2Cys6 transcription factor [Aspergillus undulatus]|uniref:Zn(II)2Cys6 transcription factor n=1 Tax=Aspergillus undulatus TaxID=1810928 RepID=UPI003CCCF337
MPPRRSHTKSRNGCDQCKKRRVKCDERGPPCSNCTSRELECVYSKAPVPRRMSSTSASPTTSAYGYNATPNSVQPYQNIPYSEALAATELRRLELMHKYSTETYQSFCNSSSDFYTWQIVVPQKAFRQDFLMKGILAAASLHIASSLDTSAAATYINTALEYHNQTLTPFRHAIDDISPENCDAVFAHSVVTTIISIALPQRNTEKDENIGAYEKIVLATELLQGVRKILKICRGWLQFKPLTAVSDFWERSSMGLDPETAAALDKLASLTDETASPEQHSMFKEAVQLLRQCYTRFANTRDIASILAWLAAADKELIYAFRCRQPLAMLILMYWGVLLHELHSGLWWARNAGSALVLDLLPELQPYRLRWESVLLWPKQKIGLQGHLIKSDGADAGTPTSG